MKKVSQYVIYFFIYSVIGGIVETVFRFVTEGQWYGIHGFLHLPLLPIYGFGAVFIILICQRIRNPVVLFFAGMAVATVLEFISHWLIEIIFGQRIWDYSEKPFNLQGRISLDNSIGFGFAALLLVSGVHHFLQKWINKVPSPVARTGAVIIVVVVLVDTVISVVQRLEM